jgi:5-formyltetrahydrofolate cyclo-ligase
MDKAELRKRLRQQRQDLDQQELESHSASICQRLRLNPWIKAAHHIALYMPNDGEPDVTDLVYQMAARNRSFYLPCLDNFDRGHMIFRRWRPGDGLATNKFGIPEPRKGKIMPTWALSVVLMPLVAFDKDCNRVGMGAGYYDKTLYIRRGNIRLLPHLMGIAHDFQEVPQLEPAPWDVSLDMVITEKRTICPEKSEPTEEETS